MAMPKSLRKQLLDTRGGEFIEYTIVVGVVALLSIWAFQIFGIDTSAVVNEQAADPAKLGF
jgi:Flp pilus assembly pilin Flp